MLPNRASRGKLFEGGGESLPVCVSLSAWVHAQAGRIGQIRVSDERLRQITEWEGRSVLEASRLAILKPAWEASDCAVGETGPTRIMVGTDGVMVPVITEAEKRKRRDNGRRRGTVRRRRSCLRATCLRADTHRQTHRQAGSKRGKRGRTRGSDQGYKEFKIVAFYDQSREHQHVAGTCGDHQVLGRLARREACRLNLGRADEKLSVTDGAEWIRRQLSVRLPVLDAMVLDFYHLAEHVGKAGRVCFGEGTTAGEGWVHRLLTTAKAEGAVGMLAQLHETRKSVRSETGSWLSALGSGQSPRPKAHFRRRRLARRSCLCVCLCVYPRRQGHADRDGPSEGQRDAVEYPERRSHDGPGRP
jgi:hypothetical protein